MSDASGTRGAHGSNRFRAWDKHGDAAGGGHTYLAREAAALALGQREGGEVDWDDIMDTCACDLHPNQWDKEQHEQLLKYGERLLREYHAELVRIGAIKGGA